MADNCAAELCPYWPGEGCLRGVMPCAQATADPDLARDEMGLSCQRCTRGKGWCSCVAMCGGPECTGAREIPKRGRCPECGGDRNLEPDGTLRFHEVTVMDADHVLDECPGTGKQAVSTHA